MQQSSSSPLSINQASVVAIFTAVVGQACALVPDWHRHEAVAIQFGSFAIAIAFLVAHAISNHGIPKAEKVVAEAVSSGEDAARAAAHEEIASLDLGSVAVGLMREAMQDQSLGDVEAQAKSAAEAEVRRILAGLSSPQTASAVSAPVSAPPAPQPVTPPPAPAPGPQAAS